MPFSRRTLGRTPLGSSLKEWMRLASDANQIDDERGSHDSDASIDEVLSRRDVLKTAGAGAVALAGTSSLGSLVGSGYHAFMPEKAGRVIVLGGGIAGLSAGYYLNRGGIAAEVYEGQNRIGGRIYSAHNVMGQGLTTEMGAEFIDSDDYEMRKFVKMFDLPLIDVAIPSEAKLWNAYYFGGRMRHDKEILQTFKPFAKKIAADSKNVVANGYKDSNALARKLDHLSISQYMHDIGIEGWLYDLLNVSYLTENGSSCDVQSSLNLIGEIGTNTSAKTFKDFGASNQQYKVRGGNHQVPAALARRLGNKIHLGMKLVKIGMDSAGAYELTFETNGKTKVVKADTIVVTLPFTTLREVEITVDLPQIKKTAINDLNYGMNAKLILGFNHHYWRDMGTCGLFFTDLPIQSGWDSSQLQNTTYASLSLFFGGEAAVDLAKTDIQSEAKMYLPQIDMMYPGAMKEFNGKLTRFNWPHWPWSKASYSTYAVGQSTKFGGAERMTVGHMYFAGEHTSDDQGFMESGAETGVMAAKAILKAFR
ncbi:NAD(P)/FAD-dependent oxidoreductase [soil metagenome]